jgi:predicted GTPase
VEQAQRPRRRRRASTPTTCCASSSSTPRRSCSDRVTLVDTPGVNDLNLQRAEITYGYVPRADAVVFLLDAGQILKESERRFLRDRLLGAGRDRIVFAINKADLLSESERTEVMEYATRQLETPRARALR